MTGMELLDFLGLMVPCIIAAYLISRWISMKDAANRYKYQKEAQISANNRRAAQIRGEQYEQRRQAQKTPQEEVAEIGKWVYDLADTFGFDPDVVLQDEMPDEVKRLLPLAKGFMESGGLAKLLAPGAAAPGPQQESPTGPVNGPGWQ